MTKLTTGAQSGSVATTGDQKPSTAIVGEIVTENKELAVHEDNDVFAEYAGAGLENVTLQDILIPRIGILQQLSPQLKKGKPEYNEHAKEADIYDLGMGEIIGDAVPFVPVHYSKVWLEWWPRSTGKGLANIHLTNTVLEQCGTGEDGRSDNVIKTGERKGNLIQETHQLFGLALIGENFSIRQCFIPFASTQIKKCKRIITFANAEKIMTSKGEITPPLFFRYYILSSQPESNTSGDWHGWSVERGTPISELPNARSIMAAAIEMRKQVESGAAYADMSQEDAMDRMSAKNYADPDSDEKAM